MWKYNRRYSDDVQEFKIKITPNFLSVAEGLISGVRIVAEEGSMRSGKTYAVMQNLIWLGYDLDTYVSNVVAILNAKYQEEGKELIDGDKAIENLKTLFRKRSEGGFAIKAFRRKSTTARQSIWKDAKRILHDFGWFDNCKMNETMMTINFPSGNEFMCCGADEPDKYHSVAQDVVYFCEVLDFKEAVFNQINGRTTHAVIIDWNPNRSRHWVFDKILKRPPTELHYHHSTYKSNPFLTDKQIAEIESWKPTPENYAKGTADEWQWRVYGEGKRGVRQGCIFDPRSWEVIKDDQYPDENNCLLHGYGLDFGFSNDPTALIECALSNNTLYLREIVYDTNLLVQKAENARWQDSLIGILDQKNFSKSVVIIADSASPESISQLAYSGYNVRAVSKFNGSIVEGINRLRGFKIKICESSTGILYEMENYHWKIEGSTGIVGDIPEDKDNHAIDAVRYWALENLTPQKTGVNRRRRKSVTIGRKPKKW